MKGVKRAFIHKMLNPKELTFFNENDLTFDSFIAEGGYGSIYKVFSSKYNKYFALKRIPINIYNEEELNCFKLIDDTRIVNLYKCFKFENCAYLLMEFCPNSVDNLLRTKSIFTEQELARYIYEMLLSVKACHDRKIAHCDIKPSNFLMDSYGRIKICDFGLSKIMKEELNCSSFSGTKLYMAPEIVSKREFNPIQADIWALGVTFYVLATHQYPFFSNNTKYLFEKINRGIFDKEKIEDPILRSMIVRCLDIDPNNRPSIDELLDSPFFTYLKTPQQITRFRISKNLTFARSHDVVVRPKFNQKSALTPVRSQVLFKTTASVIPISV